MITLRTLVLLALSAVVYGQTASFPGSLATDAQLKVAVNGKTTTLTSPITAISTIMSVADCTGIGPNVLVTVDQEIMNAASCVGTILVINQRGFDNTAAVSHLVATNVTAFVDAWHHNSVAAEVKAIEGSLGVGLLNVAGVRVTQTFTGTQELPFTHGLNNTNPTVFCSLATSPFSAVVVGINLTTAGTPNTSNITATNAIVTCRFGL
jgi:hypothetical protein